VSGKTIRTGSGEAAKASATDWAKLNALDDAAIDAAIATDPDAYALDREVLGRAESAYHYEVYQSTTGGFRWRLVGADGRGLAASEHDFETMASARDAIAELRKVMLGGNLLAA
jgi:uncharacterized protein YegP (UPF0339 family)